MLLFLLQRETLLIRQVGYINWGMFTCIFLHDFYRKQSHFQRKFPSLAQSKYMNKHLLPLSPINALALALNINCSSQNTMEKLYTGQ